MDKQFSTRYIPKTNAVIAARRAVLRPLVGKYRTLPEYERKVLLLADDWRGRLADLRKAGWGPCREDKAYQYLRNCPPAMLAVNENTRPCNRRHICPFCYAREIQFIYSIVEKGYYAPNTENYSLITRTKILTYSKNSDINRAINTIKADWPEIVEEIDALGAYFGITLAPNRNGTTIDIFVRYILMVSNNISLPEWLADSGRIFTDITHRKLALIVGSTFRYPKGLMKGDPKLTVSILNKRHDLRLSSSFGNFRKTLTR